MMDWKVENMELRNTVHKHKFGYNTEYDFPQMRSCSRDDKIAFIDALNEGIMSYVLNLIDSWNSEADNMPKDAYENVKTVSLIGWCKRKDKEKKIVDRDYKYGRIYLLGCERYIYDMNRQYQYDRYKDIVDEVFYRQLIKCLNQEEQYFKTIDPYEIAKAKVREYSDRYHTTFGIRLAFSSSDNITVIEDEESRRGPKITLDQCYLLISKYQILEGKIAEMTEEVTNQFNNL